MKLFSLFILIIFYSCSSTHFVKRSNTDINNLNKELENEKVTIVLNNGQEIDGEQVYVSTKTIDWLDPKTNETQFIQLSKINRIIIKDNGGGALEGLGFGAITGIVAGIMAENSSTPKDNNSGTMLKNVGKGIGEAIGFTVSCFTGLTIGAMIGHTNNYIFNDPQSINGKDKYQSREIYTIEIKSIIKKTGQYITVLWGQKAIRLPWSAIIIIEIKNNDNKTIINVSKETYNTYFK